MLVCSVCAAGHYLCTNARHLAVQLLQWDPSKRLGIARYAIHVTSGFGFK
jgi:hypothetical protein